MAKGIVITPPFRAEGSSFILESSSINPISFRQWLLYWDKIDLPDNNLISTQSSPDIEFLEAEHHLVRTKVRFNQWHGQNLGYAFLLMQQAAFEKHSEEEPGEWSIAQPNNELILPFESSQPIQTIEVELYKALPVPDENISFDDVLRFKERRNSELLQFRGFMDDLYLEIVNSRDIPRAKNRAIHRLQQGLEDLHRVMSESSIRRRFSTLKVELNLSNIVKDALIVSAAGSVAFGLSPEVGAIIATATSAIKICMHLTPMGIKIPENLRPYAYLSKIEEELR